MKRIFTSAWLALIIAGLGCAPSGSIAPQPPDLSGTWILNSAESEDPRDKFEEGSRDAGERQRRIIFPPTISAAIAASRVFRIEQADTAVTLSSAEGPRFTFFPDGREVVRQIDGLGEVNTVSRWKGDRFVVERRLDGGATISTTYELSDEGKQLQVNTKIGGIGRSIKFRRVYDAASSGS